MAYLQMFSEVFIELQREIYNHPDLVELLQKHPQKEFEILFAEICLYCNIAVDGTFDQEGLEAIAQIAVTRLRKSRDIIILEARKASEIVAEYRKGEELKLLTGSRAPIIVADDIVQQYEQSSGMVDTTKDTIIEITATPATVSKEEHERNKYYFENIQRVGFQEIVSTTPNPETPDEDTKH